MKTNGGFLVTKIKQLGDRIFEKILSEKTRMSKRGSRVLRYALVNAAWNVVRNNATFKAYYDAKRAEGRSHYNALGHCAGKLVRVIWKMLTDEVEFNLE